MITESINSKLHTSVMHSAEKLTFITGKPIRCCRLGQDENRKTTYLTFVTERGIEDFYNKPAWCLAEAIADTKYTIRFTNL
jgi:hypothetical protein